MTPLNWNSSETKWSRSISCQSIMAVKCLRNTSVASSWRIDHNDYESAKVKFSISSVFHRFRLKRMPVLLINCNSTKPLGWASQVSNVFEDSEQWAEPPNRIYSMKFLFNRRHQIFVQPIISFGNLISPWKYEWWKELILFHVHALSWKSLQRMLNSWGKLAFFREIYYIKIELPRSYFYFIIPQVS